MGGAVHRTCAEALKGCRNTIHTIKTDHPCSKSNANEKPTGRETGGFIVIASTFWHVLPAAGG